MELQDISNTIESILCGFELKCEELFNDKNAIGLLELFFDKYYFKELELNFGPTEEKELFNEMVATLEKDLSFIPKEQRIKVMASIYRSIQRRTNGGREYLQFAQQYVGVRPLTI
jgi:vacuolar-type H+-ATPase subunit C/Vma6